MTHPLSPAAPTAPLPDLVWVPGGVVPRLATVPLEQGVPAVARFANRCWRQNEDMKFAALRCDEQLSRAESALHEVIERVGFRKDLAVALLHIQTARQEL